MIELNQRLMHKRLWITVTPLASYVLSEGFADNNLRNVIYLCDIEAKCSRYTDYIAEKLLVEDYGIEEDVMKSWRNRK